MMAMMGDSYDECDTSMILEPTPLSEVVHQQHVLNQQQQQRIQEQHLYFVENSDDYLFRSSKRQRGQPLRVSFSSEAMVHSSPRRIDEIASMWYSREELAIFKTDRKLIVKALKKVNFDLSRIDRNEFCLRGLEPYLSISFNKRMQQKRAQVIHNVMKEQARQRSKRQNDVEGLRGICCYATEWARERAHELGINDARELGFPVVLEASSSWGHDYSNVSQNCYSGSSSSVVSISPTMKSTERKHLAPQTSTASPPGPIVKPCLQFTKTPPTAATPAFMSCTQQLNQQQQQHQQQYIHGTATATPAMNSSWSPIEFVQPNVSSQNHALAATSTATTYPSAAVQPGDIVFPESLPRLFSWSSGSSFPDQCYVEKNL